MGSTGHVDGIVCIVAVDGVDGENKGGKVNSDWTVSMRIWRYKIRRGNMAQGIDMIHHNEIDMMHEYSMI